MGALPEQIAAAIVPKNGDFELENLGNTVPKVPKPVATPSKAELCRQWFKAHPDDLKLPGRDLEALRQPQGVTVSYKYWNKIKKEF